MPRQPAPVAVPIASYIGQHIRLIAICDDCLKVSPLRPDAQVREHGAGFTTMDLKCRLRCGRCGYRNAALQVNGSPEGLLARIQWKCQVPVRPINFTISVLPVTLSADHNAQSCR